VPECDEYSVLLFSGAQRLACSAQEDVDVEMAVSWLLLLVVVSVSFRWLRPLLGDATR